VNQVKSLERLLDPKLEDAWLPLAVYLICLMIAYWSRALFLEDKGCNIVSCFWGRFPIGCTGTESTDWIDIEFLSDIPCGSILNDLNPLV
jgi:hypothetical protein